MYKIQNGRLYPDLVPPRLSFAIPEGFWLETEPLTVSENQLTFWTQEKDARVEVRMAEKDADTTEEELNHLIHGWDPVNECYEEGEDSKNAEGPYPVEHSGFKGHWVISHGPVTQCTVLLDISSLGLKNGNGDAIERIEILVMKEQPDTVKEIMERSSIKRLLESFAVE